MKKILLSLMVLFCAPQFAATSMAVPVSDTLARDTILSFAMYDEFITDTSSLSSNEINFFDSVIVYQFDSIIFLIFDSSGPRRDTVMKVDTFRSQSIVRLWKSPLSIGPNPCTNAVTLRSNNAILNVNLRDISGRLLWQKNEVLSGEEIMNPHISFPIEENDFSLVIPMDSFPAGNYFLEVFQWTPYAAYDKTTYRISKN